MAKMITPTGFSPAIVAQIATDIPKSIAATVNRAGIPLEGCFAPPDQPRLIGHYIYENPVPHSSVANEHFDGGEFHRLLTQTRWR